MRGGKASSQQAFLLPLARLWCVTANFQLRLTESCLAAATASSLTQTRAAVPLATPPLPEAPAGSLSVSGSLSAGTGNAARGVRYRRCGPKARRQGDRGLSAAPHRPTAPSRSGGASLPVPPAARLSRAETGRAAHQTPAARSPLPRTRRRHDTEAPALPACSRLETSREGRRGPRDKPPRRAARCRATPKRPLEGAARMAKVVVAGEAPSSCREATTSLLLCPPPWVTLSATSTLAEEAVLPHKIALSLLDHVPVPLLSWNSQDAGHVKLC